MASHIDVVGLGVAADAVLPASARAALASARVIIGSPRQQAWLNRQPGDWPPMEDLPPLANLEEKLAAIPGAVAVLASGDPLHYGIGHWFSRHYAPDQLAFHPAVSSIQAMCSRLGLSQPHCHVITLHGRPAASIRRHLVAGRTLIVLTDRTSNPVFLARACCEAGLDRSTVHVGERLGYDDERLSRCIAGELAEQSATTFEQPLVAVLELVGNGHGAPSFPGIEDTRLVTDGAPGEGMITKREVRLQILSLLDLAEHGTLWDVGAGCGGVATELALWRPDCKVFAVEQHPSRVACIEANRNRFGVTNLQVVTGRAPDALATLPSPDRVFVGGSDGQVDALVTACYDRLPEGGVLVASAVTEHTDTTLRHLCQALTADASAITLGVRRERLDNGRWSEQAKRPVTLFQLRKTTGTRT